jgi:sedoheptulokinase
MKFIGLDIGTTSICGLVLDAETGRVLDSRTQKNTAALSSEKAWECIQDPAAILEITEAILKSFITTHDDIQGISLTGQMHGIVYVDAWGNAVSPLYTWHDGRGNLLCRDRKTYAEVLTEQTGYAVSTGMGCVTHFYHQLNKSVPNGASCICTIHEYVSMKLAGKTVPVTDTTDAASMGCFNLKSLCFDKQALERAGFDTAILPEIVSVCAELGKTKEGIPVYTAMGDNQASFLGAVKNIGHSVLVNVGTGSQVSAHLDEYIETPGLDIRPFPSGGYLYVGAPLCGGKSFSLLRDFFNKVLVMFTGQSSEMLYDTMESVPFNYLPPEDLLKVDPRFDGSRLAPGVRGSIGNIGISNFSPENLVLSFQDGMARELYDLYRLFPEPLKERVQMLVCSGNGVRKNKALQQFLEKYFKHPVHIPVYEEEASYGAALLTAVGRGCLHEQKDLWP